MDAVDEAFEAVPRSGFLHRGMRLRAGYDGPLPIGHGGTCSQPRTVADMLRLLDVHPGDRVLDVGSGSGWTTALLGHLVGPHGQVVGVEIEPHLAQWGAENVARAGMPWARARAADPHVLGLPAEGPWDRILVSAESRHLPQALVDQLADPGRLVAPVAGRMALVVLEGGAIRVTKHGYYRFVPLQTPAPPLAAPDGS
ncbi:MAG TPA: protein-L-isoaspartate O-methyltransferase [Humibacillus sp.]|nr:protein-L-isoaspartate O-methyltransferase [Humibacillus sp.]